MTTLIVLNYIVQILAIFALYKGSQIAQGDGTKSNSTLFYFILGTIPMFFSIMVVTLLLFGFR